MNFRSPGGTKILLSFKNLRFENMISTEGVAMILTC